MWTTDSTDIATWEDAIAKLMLVIKFQSLDLLHILKQSMESAHSRRIEFPTLR